MRFSDLGMPRALELAHAAAQQGDVPVGAVILRAGLEIAVAGNEVMQRHDPTAHAELLVIQRASQALGQRFLEECDLYITLEPCPMCCHAISLARIRRVYFGAYDPKGGGAEHGPRIFEQASCFHKPEVYGGLNEEACSMILRDFFKSLRGA